MCETCGGHGPEHRRAGTHPHAHDACDSSRRVEGHGIRVAIVGKGGVGKSTITALMARQLAREGLLVVAVDADEQRNLGATLGMALEAASAVIPVAEDGDYIEEKTGARPGEGAGGLLVLNPDTADLIDRMSVPAPDGVRLVVMGGIREAGGGCLCPETALISSAVAAMHLHDEDVVVMDTHAGVEHFGRALARGFDAAVVVVDPTFNAVQVGLESAKLARELGIDHLHLAINRTRSNDDLERVMQLVDMTTMHFTSVTTLPYDDAALSCEPSVERLLEGSALTSAVAKLSDAVLHQPIGTTH